VTEAEWLASADPGPMLTFLTGRIKRRKEGPFTSLRNWWLRTPAKAADRKPRLFACTCCRRVWHLLTDERGRAVVAAAEQYADGRMTAKELAALRAAAAVSTPQLFKTTQTSAASVLFAADQPSDWYGGFEAATRSAEAATLAAEAASLAAAGRCAESAIRAAEAAGKAAQAAALRAGDLKTSKRAAAGARVREQTAQAALLRDLFGNPFRPVTVQPAWLTWNSATVPKIAQAIYDEQTFDRMPILADALEEAGCTEQSMLDHCRSGGEHVRGCWVVDALLVGKE
jgi:hypothetical protein